MSNVRIQVDFSAKRVAELTRLMEICELSTKKELLNNALSLFEWAVHEVRQGRKIAAINEATQQYKELEMHALRAAASHREAETSLKAAGL